MLDIQKTLKDSLALEGQQRYNEAMELILQARKLAPQQRPLAIRHAQLLETVKQESEALKLYKLLSDAQPNNQEAILVLGMARCLLKTSQYEAAGKLLLPLIEKLPGNPEVLTALATWQRHKGALVDAEASVTQALQKLPDFKPAVHELAEIELARKDDEAAIHTLERNVLRGDLYGDSIDLWLGTLRHLKRERYTQERLEEMVAKYPDKVEFVFALGVQAHRAGEISIARPAFEKSNQLSPNNFRILHEWGVMERIAGDIERSQELLARSLELSPEQSAALRTFGSEHKYSYGDPIFTRLNFAAARLADVQPIEQIHLHYALAKAYEDVAELDTAFRHYETAGIKKRRMESYSERNSARLFNVMPKAVNARTRELAPQKGCESEIPVFILGMPRSGTSLLEQILSSHPDIFGAGELKFLSPVLDHIQYGLNRINLNEPEAVFPYEDNASWERRGQCYVDKLQKLADKPYKRIVDKMPGNFTMLGMIKAILPNAKIIHSRRHPVETCLSNYRIHFAEGQMWSYNLRELGRYYRRYWDLMKHWRHEFPESMLEIRYEDNVADVESQARKIIDYLGLEWNAGCLNFYNTDRPVKTASATQVRKPIYTTSTNRWRKYEKYLGPLLDEIGDIVQEYESEITHLIVK